MAVNRYKTTDFEKAIPGTGGLITSIAAKVGCNWHTAKKYIESNPKLTEMVEDEAHKVDDMAESVIIRAIRNDSGDMQTAVQTAKWWLERRKREVFSTRQEVTGANGGAIEQIIVVEHDQDNSED